MKVKEILGAISYDQFLGNDETEVNKIISFDGVNDDKNALMWVSEKRLSELQNVQTGTIICPEFDKHNIRVNCNYIVTKNPRQTFRTILLKWFVPKKVTGIAGSAKIDPSVKIGENNFIGENVVIEENCSIGHDCCIGHNTVLKSDTKIGNYVSIGCNCTIGGVGFGYEKNEEGEYELIPHIGGIIISDRVEIGNNTCVDKAVLGNTFLSENVKVDNLVHIAHGVQIGNNSLIIANAMVGGSAIIGKNTWVAPSASLLNKLKVGDEAVIGMGAVVLREVQNGTTVIGNPGKVLEKKPTE